MKEQKGTPASFLLKNSKGHPDFIMTMLIAVIISMFIVILFWLMLNILAFRMKNPGNNIYDLLVSFNDNARLIILGLCSSIFSLAGAYFLRRSQYDKHYEKLKIIKNESNDNEDIIKKILTSRSDPKLSTLTHPNFDDEEEDI